MTDKEKKIFLKEFGSRVKQYRTEKGMSQEELANLVGYTSDNARSSVQKIESGKSDLPASKIHILAKSLNVPVGKLMGWYDEFDRQHDTEKLETEVHVIELIQKLHGKTASEAFHLYIQLDELDRGKIVERMETLLEQEKYSIQKELSGVKAM